MRKLIAILSLLLALFVSSASAGPIRNAATTYSVINPGTAALMVHHVITGPPAFSYAFWATVPAGSSMIYKLADMPQVPTPFSGTLTLSAEFPFQGQIVGYELQLSPTSK